MSDPIAQKRHAWRSLRRITRLRLAPWVVMLHCGLWALLIIAGYLPQEENEEQEFDPRAQRSALVTWDRLHRLNAALETKPQWIRRIIGHEPRLDLLEQTYAELDELSASKLLDRRGRGALAIMEELLAEALPEEEVVEEDYEEEQAFDVEPLVETSILQPELRKHQWQLWEKRLQEGDLMWWEIEFLENKAHEQKIDLLDDELATQRQKNEALYQRSFYAQLATAGFFLTGLLLLPRCIRHFRSEWPTVHDHKVVRYSGRISISLMLVFLICLELLNNGLMDVIMFLGQAWSQMWWWEMSTDTLWRLLPVLVLILFFYRKPSWAARSFGLAKKPRWDLIVGMYALLIVLDLVLNGIMSLLETQGSPSDLDPMERGWAGLVYGLISACLVAPLAEEFLYRGFLFQSLWRKTGFLIAALLSSLVFSVTHFYDLYGTISVALCGMATAWLYASTRSLTNAILLHMVYNLSITIPSWLLFHADL